MSQTQIRFSDGGSVTFNKQHCKTGQTSPRKLVRDRRPFHQQNQDKSTKLKEANEMLINCQMWITYPPTHFLLKASLNIFEDSEALIKMIIKGRSPTMRHVSGTHRVALDWLFHRINLEPKIQTKYVDTKNQLADMLTRKEFHA